MALKIKQINAFNLVVLRIAGFIEYVEQVDKLFKEFRDTDGNGQSPLPTKAETFYTAFAQAVGRLEDAFKIGRTSDYTRQIANEDRRRDNLFMTLKSQVQMYQRFDFDEEMMSAAETIWNVIKRYQVDVEINYSEESTQLQQMIEEMETDCQTKAALDKLGLGDQLQQLKTANEAVRTMMAQRNDERTAHGKAALATARKETNAAYHDLVAMLNAFALTDDDPHRFDELISQVNELIKYYRLHVVPKPGKKDEESEEGGSSSAGGDTDQ
ncbi:MAG: hypothetical protein J6W05_03875 [Prevotella sp.]|nr:hypothetical protein [Prevotella sp.]